MKKILQKIIGLFGYKIIKEKPAESKIVNVDREYLEILDENPDLFDISQRANPKLYTTYCAVKYVVKNDIKGSFVECGVYKGRMVAMMALTLLKFGCTDRKIYMFDTFSGMTGISEFDYKPNREGYSFEYNLNRQSEMQRGEINLRCYSSKDMVFDYIKKTKYPANMFIAVEGDVLQTLPYKEIKGISFLRLDTDWYKSTKHELECLYPLLVKGGVFSQDDYGSWAGAKKAVDEFFSTQEVSPVLFRVGDSEVATLKLD